MEEVKLFGYPISPFSCRVEVALKLKGVEYELIVEDPSKKSDMLLQYNPVNKKIPVLLHNRKPIVESAVIIEYIDEIWKTNPILPHDPYEKAKARFWAKFVEEKCMPALFKTIWSTGDQYEKDKAEAVEVLKFLENELEGKKFFGGDGIGFVDIVANIIAFWFLSFQEALGLDVLTKDNLPKLCKWAEDYVNCNDIKKCLPPKDQLIANFPPPYMGEQLVALFKSRVSAAAAAKLTTSC